MKEYKTIVWDFNGTLIDDVNAALSSVNDILRRRNQPAIDLKKYKWAVDSPISKFYDRIFLPGTVDLKKDCYEFDEGYERHLKTNPIMDGALETVRYFSEHNKTQVVISASQIDKVRKRLNDISLSEYFSEVLARKDLMATDKLYLAEGYFKENGINPEETVVIGDCVADFQMAEALSCDCVLTTKGHQGRDEFKATTAIVIDSLLELKNIVK
ncbi:MAG: HAD hydrolase-like protein [Oscillospiraceae bacterium]|nr:HAD hydrolase-like protein [Oscillospiraceae bacterium]